MRIVHTMSHIKFELNGIFPVCFIWIVNCVSDPCFKDQDKTDHRSGLNFRPNFFLMFCHLTFSKNLTKCHYFS